MLSAQTWKIEECFEIPRECHEGDQSQWLELGIFFYLSKPMCDLQTTWRAWKGYENG